MATTSESIPSFTLLDGTKIPWLAWGNGTGQAQKDALESGRLAIMAGLRHIDTAQIYGTEKETGEVVSLASVPKDEIFVTTKVSPGVSILPNGIRFIPVPLDQVRESIEGSVEKLGFVPDLLLIHNPFVAPPGELKALWKILESLKDEGSLKSIGVSNFRVQDLETILDGAKHKPVVNQIEYHPYVLAHLEPLLLLQEKHGIVTESYGSLTPILRHPSGGPLKPVLDRIATRISKETGKTVTPATVLLLWTRAQGAVVVSASGNADRIKALGDASRLPDLLHINEVEEIRRVGRTIHFRHYREHMEEDFPLPNLPSDLQ